MLSVVLVAMLCSAQSYAYTLRPTFYVPMSEDNMDTQLDQISASVDQLVDSLIWLTIASDQTIILWDHWENGYDSDFGNNGNPTYCTTGPNVPQACTEVWGDGESDNGCNPNNPCNDAGDIFANGEVVTLITTLTVPRDSNVTAYDGEDRVGATLPIVMTRAGHPTNGESVFNAGAIEVEPETGPAWSSAFVVPIGEDILNPPDLQFAFDRVWLYIMADSDGSIAIDADADGNVDDTLNVFQGQSYLYGNGVLGGPVNVGATLISGDVKFQVHMAAFSRNGISEFFQNRWFTLAPVDLLSDTYLSPVGTEWINGTGNDACSQVFVYNPNSTEITVIPEINAGIQTDFAVQPGEVVAWPSVLQNLYGSGILLSSEGGEKFSAIQVVDCDTEGSHDWGFPLVPESVLTASVLVGGAPACRLPTASCPPSGVNHSPVWVTALEATTVYTNYDGRAIDCIDPTNNDNNPGIPLARLQSIRITDTDFSMTGARIGTCDEVQIAAAYGQDPATAADIGGGTQELDFGTAVLPFNAEIDVTKIASPESVPVGGTVTYTYLVYNNGQEPLENVTMNDDICLTVTPIEDESTACSGGPCNIGDTTQDELLDFEEAWQFQCAQSILENTVNVITACALRAVAPLGQVCAEDQETVTVTGPGSDFGDAPTSDPKNYGAASHILSLDGVSHGSELILGLVNPDIEAGNQPDGAAMGDDSSNIDDEDGITTSADVIVHIQSMRAFANVHVENPSDTEPGQLVGWIDFNDNGEFDNACGGIAGSTNGFYHYTNYCERSLPALAALAGSANPMNFSGNADGATSIGAVTDPTEAIGVNDGTVADITAVGGILELDLAVIVPEGETISVWANGPTGTESGNADAVSSQTGVVDPSFALGIQNDSGAQFNSSGDVMVLDLTVTVPETETITIRAYNNSFISNRSLNVDISPDNSTWTAAIGSPLNPLPGNPGTYVDFDFNVPGSTGGARYVRLTTNTGFFNNTCCRIFVDSLSYSYSDGGGTGMVSASVAVLPAGPYTPVPGTLDRTGASILDSDFTVPVGSGGARYIQFTWVANNVGIDAVAYDFDSAGGCDLTTVVDTGTPADGTFTTGNIPIGCTNATAQLYWSNIDAGSGIPPNLNTFMRLRLTADTTGDNSFFTDDSPQPTGPVTGGEVEDHMVDLNPTAVTIGKVEIESVDVEVFLQGIGAYNLSDSDLLSLLATFSPDQAAALEYVDRIETIRALRQFIDPDGDGVVAVFEWETLEQRGTVGFYVERLEPGKNWSRLNNSLLPAIIPAPLGGEYMIVDPQALSGNTYQYRLIELEAWGSQQYYGPFEVKME